MGQKKLYLKCGCRVNQDFTGILGAPPPNNPQKPGDPCYCGKHGQVVACEKEEMERHREARRRR